MHLQLYSNRCQTNRTSIDVTLFFSTLLHFYQTIRKLHCHSIWENAFLFRITMSSALAPRIASTLLLPLPAAPRALFSWSLSLFHFFAPRICCVTKPFSVHSSDFIVLTKLLQVRVINGHARNVIETARPLKHTIYYEQTMDREWRERARERENRKHTGQNGDIERIKESESERGIWRGKKRQNTQIGNVCACRNGTLSRFIVF